MYKLKVAIIPFTLLAMLLGVSLFAGAFIFPASPTAAAEKGMRQFYLTTTSVNGSQPLTACAIGYHMASIWEIFDPSNLRYNTEFGYTQGDSGFGPPTGFTAYGWIRTGAPAALGVDNPSLPGRVNCNAWTVGTSAGFGSIARFSQNWQEEGIRLIAEQDAGDCDLHIRVWCVQD